MMINSNMKEEEDKCTLVMSHPNTFREFFEGVFMALDLDPDQLSMAELVSTEWRDFVRNRLFQSEKVVNYVTQKWLRSTPNNYEARCKRYVRCLVGDERQLLAGLYQGWIEVWNKQPLRKFLTLKRGHVGTVFCLALNEDLLVSGSFDKTVCVWNRNNSFDLVQSITNYHEDMVYGVALNTNNVFVSCCHASTVRVWKYQVARTGSDEKPEAQVENRLLHLGNLVGHKGGVKSVDIDNHRVVTCSRDATVLVWDLDTLQCVKKIELCGSPSVLKMFQYPELLIAIKTTNFSGSEVGHVVRLYNLQTGRCTRSMYGHQSRIISLCLDHRKIASGDEEGNLLIWDKNLPPSTSETYPSNILKVFEGSKVTGIVFEKHMDQGLYASLSKSSIRFLNFLEAKD